jgi:chorismate-pyruvate lyase
MRKDLSQSLGRRAIDPLTLGASRRVLLTTDGTVTEILEAFSGERIRVVKLFQEQSRLKRPLSALEVPGGHEILSRQVLLQGCASLVNFIYAESIIALGRLDEDVRFGLLHSQKSIGLLILEKRIETFKEILDCDRKPAGPLAKHFHVSARTPVLSRTYRMITNGCPVMLITERFPERCVWDRVPGRSNRAGR